jgi:diguanylate cyclase (GGDEF)-like protein
MSFSRTPSRVHAAFVALSVVSLVVYTLGGDLGRGITLTAMSGSVAVSIAAIRLRIRSTGGVAWSLAFIAFCFLTITGALWLVFVDIGGAASPPQPLADLSRAVGYLFLLGAALFVVSPTAKRDTGGVLDASTVGVGGALALWLTILDPALDEADATAPDRIYALAVLVILSALAGALLRAATTSSAARPALHYFLVAVTLTLAGNVLAVTAADSRTGATPTWVSGIWPFAYAAAWAAAMHPASERIHEGAQRLTGSRLSPRRIVLLGAALSVGPLFGVFSEVVGSRVDWLTLSIAELLLVAMVLIRVAQLAAAHRASTAELEYLAHHDSLTGLANRRAVDRHLNALVARIGTGDAPGVVVLFVDLNGFKGINDDYGHGVGDELLTAVAARLAGSVRRHDGDLAGRVGGDEFVLVVEGEPLAVGGSAMARAHDAFAPPFLLASGPLLVSASIGLASASSGTHTSVDGLLTRADHAMYEHKRALLAPETDPGPQP